MDKPDSMGVANAGDSGKGPDELASYRAIFDAAEIGMLVHDWQSGLIVDANSTACEMFGRPRENLLQAGLAELLVEHPSHPLECSLDRLKEARAKALPPFDWLRKDRTGQLRRDEVRLKPVTIEGTPYVVAFCRDVTQARLDHEHLQLREEQYRAIFDGSVDMLVLWDDGMVVVDVNEAYTALVGIQREELLGKKLEDRDDAGEMRHFIPFIQSALQGHPSLTVRRVTGVQGRAWDVEVRYLPVFFGGRTYALGIGRDVTKRLERERQVLRSEARLRATVEAAFDCVIGMDGDGRIIEFNKAAERVFGRRRSEVMHQRLSDVLLPREMRDDHERGLKRFHESGQGKMLGRLVETNALRADGSEFPVELAISVADDPEGTIFVCYLRDITDRKRAHAEHEALEAQLRQAQKMEAVGRLTGGIAHDFNNILTSIIGYLVLAEERAQPLGDAALVRQLGQAQLASQRAKDLIAQMLTFVRRKQTEPRPIELIPLVEQTLSLLHSAIPPSVSLRLDPPTPAHKFVTRADAVQLEQVLFNLCINAKDAMNGVGTVTVRLKQLHQQAFQCASCKALVKAGSWVAIEVEDEGEGISPDVLDRVFDPFFTTKPPGKGTGMGLAIVHGIVHDHAGHLLVHSQADQGTSINILLPKADFENRIAGSVKAHHYERGAPRQLEGTVLVVDDESMVGDFLVELLQGWGLQPIYIDDPVVALTWLEDPKHKVDLLLTDQTMPGMTGLELAASVRARRKALPMLLMSGDARQFDQQRLDEHGVRQALTKPLDAKQLRQVLSDLLV